MKIAILILSVFLSISTYAATDGIIKVEGKLVGFDDKKVELDTGAQKVYVPRAAFKSMDGYVAGKAVLTAETTLSEFLKLNLTK